MARFSDTPITASTPSKLFPMELILPVPFVSFRRRNPRSGPEFVAVFITDVCAHSRNVQDGRDNEEFWLFSWGDDTISEDCLYLNVWTAGLDNGKRAVMVWLPGSGFTAGSSAELASDGGENLGAGFMNISMMTYRNEA